MWYLLILIVLLWYFSEGMTDQEKTDHIMKNKHLFDPAGTLDNTRKKLNWVDPVTYCDTTELFRTNKFTENNILRVV